MRRVREDRQGLYPPQMKDLPGADELTRQAIEEGIDPQEILLKGLMPGMERVGIKFRRTRCSFPRY